MLLVLSLTDSDIKSTAACFEYVMVLINDTSDLTNNPDGHKNTDAIPCKKNIPSSRTVNATYS